MLHLFSPLLTTDELYMHRCLQLAPLGSGHTAPNPLVGAVLVYEGQVIGEGYHQQFGGPHAEPNCIDSVKEKDKALIPSSTLYVSLEPCSHVGKTPPCADLIIRHKIPRVVIGCRDPFNEVNGKGIEKLLSAGVEVTVGILEKECRQLNKRFFTFHTKQQPYIILKWAQTANRKMSTGNSDRLLISNEYSNRLVHNWRCEEAAILVGTNTALLDDPMLTNRHWTGPSPLRLVLDRNLRLPSSLNIFQQYPTIVFNNTRNEKKGTVHYYQLPGDGSVPQQLLKAMYALNIQSVLIEGGAALLQSFIDERLWNEARIITNRKLEITTGLPSPEFSGARLTDEINLFSDNITFYTPHE